MRVASRIWSGIAVVLVAYTFTFSNCVFQVEWK